MSRSSCWKQFAGLIILTFGVIAPLSPAGACRVLVNITYAEDSPDSFLIQLSRETDFRLESVTIDLRPSFGRAYIDSFEGDSGLRGNNGVEVDRFEGFEEGSQVGRLVFKRFLPGQAYDFNIDLDDNSPVGQDDTDHLWDGEMRGATATAWLIGPNGHRLKISGQFDAEGYARLTDGLCA